MDNLSRGKTRHKVAVLVCEQVRLASLGLALDVFRMANQLPGRHRFEVLRFSEDGREVPHEDGSLRVDGGPALMSQVDAVVLPSLWTMGAQAVVTHPRTIAALQGLGERSWVATMCTGVYLLAATGRLDGRLSTTHWLLGNRLQADFPALEVACTETLVEHGRMICSGGAMSGVDACLRLVTMLTDERTARQLADLLVTDLRHGPQSAYAAAWGRQHHRDHDIRRLQAHIESGSEREFSLESMAELMHVSVRTLQRRFLAATGVTPIQYLQSVRIERGKILLAQDRVPVSEVAARVGYQDRVAFGRVFKKLVGVTPAAYRQKHQPRLA